MSDTFTPDYTKNVASRPEAWGLKVVAHIEQPNLSYEFDEYYVWVDQAGLLYYAQDSGCSCPTPFEDIRHPSELTRLPEEQFEAFRTEVRQWFSGLPTELTRFFSLVLNALSSPADAKVSEEEVAAYLERKAAEEFRAQVIDGLGKCRTELREVVPAIDRWSDSTLADTVIALQKTKTTEILVLGVYLTRMAEHTLKSNTDSQF